MALTDKLTAIADSIRAKTGSTGLLSLDEMPEMIEAISGEDETTTYILVDENGYEIPAVLVDEEVTLTANAATDIRAGTTAVTNEGIVTGEKEIPAYYVTEGTQVVPAGSSFTTIVPHGRYEYTKLQAMFCMFNTSLSDSVAVDRVVINTHVYPVNSTDAVSEVMPNDETESIDFGLINDSGSTYIIRYFTYKEEY